MRNVTLKTTDRQRIEATHHEQGFKKAVILAHGFFNAKDAYLFREIANAISEHYDVIAFDFRGHGKSSGLFTWTSKECADLKAVINYTKDCGYESIGLMGFSLGAAISVIETSQNLDINSLIAVSAPYDFWEINFHFWEPAMIADLKLNLGEKAKGKGIRPGNPFDKKVKPISVVGKISPRPVLFIHGEEDWLIKSIHSRKLYEKAKEPKAIEMIKKGGHAEILYDTHPDLFMKLTLDWFKSTL
ncbi:MAG: alpha/beta fold hydrolase [Candidatus Omnitrophota bacterium]